MDFKTSLIGYYKPEADKYLNQLEESLQEDTKQAYLVLSKLDEQANELRRKRNSLQRMLDNRQKRLNEVSDRISCEYISSVDSIHTTLTESKQKQDAMKKEISTRKEEMDRIEEMTGKLCKALDNVYNGLDNSWEDIDGR